MQGRQFFFGEQKTSFLGVASRDRKWACEPFTVKENAKMTIHYKMSKCGRMHGVVMHCEDPVFTRRLRPLKKEVTPLPLP